MGKQSSTKSIPWRTIGSVLILAIGLMIAPQLRQKVELFSLLGAPPSLNAHLCEHIDVGADACEDIAIDYETSLAYLACANVANRRRWWPPLGLFDKDVTDEQDPIFVYDLNTGETSRLPMPDFDQEFRTHGMGLWTPVSSTVDVGFQSSRPLKGRLGDNSNSKVPTLTFINHRRDGSTVEIFEHHRPDRSSVSIKLGKSSDIGELRHVATIRDPLIRTPNNVHPVSRRSFYVTNDHYFPRGLMRKVEAYLALPLSNIVFSDEQGRVSEVAQHIPYPNGITGYANDTIIMVVAASSAEVFLYDRVPAANLLHANRLVLRQRIPIGLLGDNINVDRQTNHIYITGTADPLNLFKYAHNPTVTAASRTIRLDNFTIGDPSRGIPVHADPHTLLILDGPLGTAMTTSAADAKHGKTLVGGLLGQGFLVCNII